MPKVMLINVTHAEESRVAIVNDGVLEAFEIESLSREHLKGNIYKGTVHRIHPALEAAFVDIGAGRDAFLPLDEICFRNLPNPPAPQVHAEGENGKQARRRRIRDLLKSGDEILVQIVKEPFGNKPPTLTTFYSLPGRYLVLVPGSDDAGISRRIEGEERNRLRQLIADLNPPEGFGLIVRTAAGFDNSRDELSRDLSYLLRLWENVQGAATHKRAPTLVYREHDIVLRTIRDFFTPDVDEIYIDNEEVYLRAREFLGDVMPGKEHVLHLYQGEQPIFSAFDVESQFESIFKRRVALKSGGGIVIDSTEALTAIDVNSGGSVRGPNPEETAFRTNMEAAAEICRQLRLRDIGGLIVIDFIDMRDNNHAHEVEKAVRDGMRQDKARHESGRISRFGLMEISRQRMRPAAMATTYTTCPTCEGHGAIRTTESAALVALRKIHNRVALGDVASLRITMPEEVAVYLLNQKREDLAQLEQRYRTKITVKLSDKLMAHQVELEASVRQAETRAPVAPGSVAPAEPAPQKTPAPAHGKAAHPTAQAQQNGNGVSAGGDGKKKRRRRRRGKGGLKAAIALGEIFSGFGSGLQSGEGEAEEVMATDGSTGSERSDESERPERAGVDGDAPTLVGRAHPGDDATLAAAPPPAPKPRRGRSGARGASGSPRKGGRGSAQAATEASASNTPAVAEKAAVDAATDAPSPKVTAREKPGKTPRRRAQPVKSSTATKSAKKPAAARKPKKASS